jgi:hypothetical protein
VLVSFLALFVSWTGSHSWAIICFVFHQLRWTEYAKDGLYWHVQALLRATIGDSGLAWELLELGWHWKGRINRVLLRILPLVLICMLHSAGFTAAGLFSSRVVDAANEVLLLPSVNCGLIDLSLLPTSSREHTLSLKELLNLDNMIISGKTNILESKLIARTCYPRLDGTLPDLQSSLCQSLVAPGIPSNISTSEECPFAQSACLTRAVSLDTGLADSDTQFGINSPPQDRIQYRRKTVCTVIPMEERYKLLSPTFGPNTTEYYYLGNTTDLNGNVNSNYTFSVSQSSRSRMGPYSPLYVSAQRRLSQ